MDLVVLELKTQGLEHKRGTRCCMQLCVRTHVLVCPLCVLYVRACVCGLCTLCVACVLCACACPSVGCAVCVHCVGVNVVACVSVVCDVCIGTYVHCVYI